jgi:hypothetical protein
MRHKRTRNSRHDTSTIRYQYSCTPWTSKPAWKQKINKKQSRTKIILKKRAHVQIIDNGFRRLTHNMFPHPEDRIIWSNAETDSHSNWTVQNIFLRLRNYFTELWALLCAVALCHLHSLQAVTFPVSKYLTSQPLGEEHRACVRESSLTILRGIAECSNIWLYFTLNIQFTKAGSMFESMGKCSIRSQQLKNKQTKAVGTDIERNLIPQISETSRIDIKTHECSWFVKSHARTHRNVQATYVQKYRGLYLCD